MLPVEERHNTEVIESKPFTSGVYSNPNLNRNSRLVSAQGVSFSCRGFQVKYYL